jgi:MoxR-like ATPase
MIHRMHRLGEKVTHPESIIQPVISPAELMAIRATSHGVNVDEAIVNYIVEIVRGSRSQANLSLGASPRAGVMLCVPQRRWPS